MAYFARRSAGAASAKKAICPTIPYRNATAMVDWLSDAYGFEKQRVVRGEDGEVRHALLAFGDNLILVVRVEDSKLERLVVHPDQIGGVETQACYVVVPDIEAHCAMASKKGAEVVSGIERGNRGDRSYVSRDPEGHIWMFGSHDVYESRHSHKNDSSRARGGRTPLLGLAAALMVTFVAGVWVYADRLAMLMADVPRFAARGGSGPQGLDYNAKDMTDRPLQVRNAKESVERKLSQARAALETSIQGESEARALLAKERQERESLSRTAVLIEDQARRERIAREAAEQKARDAADQMGRALFAKAEAERLAKEMAAKWELEGKARALAEQSAQRAIAELAQERGARAAAELAANELRNQLTARGSTPTGILALRDQFEAERRARQMSERAAKDALLQLTQEKSSRDATERALKQVQDRLEQAHDRLAAASCWVCPSGAPCARP